MQNIIPVAVVGAGRFGRKHVEKYVLDARASLAAIVDPDPALELVARRHGVRWFPSVADLPAGLVRAASVAVPNAAHFETSAALMRAGIDVLVEKPFTLRLDEADGTVLVIGHNPGLHELALRLAAADSPTYRALAAGKFPTTARASFAIDCAWAALDRSRHRLVDYVTLKSLGDRD